MWYSTMKMKEFYTDKSKWCKEAYATDILGLPCSIYSPFATKFCPATLCKKLYGYEYVKIRQRMNGYVHRLNRVFFDVLVWNDYPLTTFEDIKKMVNKLDI